MIDQNHYKASNTSAKNGTSQSKAFKQSTSAAIPGKQGDDDLGWYRIGFSCRHLGRYVASTKRRIMWRFGSILRVRPGIDEYEEHEVVLIWSVKSGKAKLIWNKQDISRLFPPQKKHAPPPTSLEFSWQTAKGTNFLAVVHANPTGSSEQYAFFINGISLLTSIPKKDTVIQSRITETLSESSIGPDSPSISIEPTHESIPRNDDSLRRKRSHDFDESGDDLSGDDKEKAVAQQNRLAAAGFSYTFDMQQDELRSDLYSSTLDTLRDKVSAIVPETEEMLSRAIINAFSEDHDSDTSGDSLSFDSDRVVVAAEIEADVLGETFEWLKWGRDFISAFDMHDRKLEYMRKHVEQMVSHVRHERMEPSLACDIMHRIAAVLKLHVTKDPYPDTIMFENLNSLTVTQDIIDSMQRFGKISVAAISKNHEGFGFCRFLSPVSAQTVNAAALKSEVEVNGRIPAVFALFDSPYSKEIDSKPSESWKAEFEYDVEDDDDANDCNCDVILPSDECVEATYLEPRRSPRRPPGPRSWSPSQLKQAPQSPPITSLAQSPRAQLTNNQNYSTVTRSSGTVATLSTLDTEDFDSNFVPMHFLHVD